MYAKESRYFGELGKIVYVLRSFFKRKGITIDFDPNKERILDEWYSSVDDKEGEPVILKYTGLDIIEVYEDGMSFTPDDYYQEMYEEESAGDMLQNSMRVKAGVSLSAFDEVDVENEIAAANDYSQQIESLSKNLKIEAKNTLKNLIREMGPENADELKQIKEAIKGGRIDDGIMWLGVILKKESEDGTAVLVVQRNQGDEKGCYEFPGTIIESFTYPMAQLFNWHKEVQKQFGDTLENRGIINCESDIKAEYWVYQSPTNEYIIPEGAEWLPYDQLDKVTFTKLDSAIVKKFIEQGL